MKKIFIKFNSTAARLMLNTRAALSNQRGDFYISDAVKIIIAVVLGALLLAALTLIFKRHGDSQNHKGDRGIIRITIHSGSAQEYAADPFLFYFSQCAVREVKA